MNIIKSIFCVGVLLASTSTTTFAGEGSTHIPPSMKDIQMEMIEQLDHAKLDKNGIKKASAKVTFQLDGENKIHVLNVSSKEAYLINFVKNHLQGMAVDSELQQEKMYRISINFECL